MENINNKKVRITFVVITLAYLIGLLLLVPITVEVFILTLCVYIIAIMVVFWILIFKKKLEMVENEHYERQRLRSLKN